MRTLDLHTHILPPAWPDWTARAGYAGWISLERHGPGCASCRMVQSVPGGGTRHFRDLNPAAYDLTARIADLDARLGAGEWMQTLSTVPVMFSYWARPADAHDLSRLLNDHIADCCRTHPSKFVGLGTLPMQDPALACRELERCINVLHLRGVQIGTHISGRNLDDPAVVAVLREAARLGAAVFVHPWEMLAIPADPGATLPVPPDINPRLREHWLAWLIGMPSETAIAIASVIMGGVLDELPTLRIGFAHGGGALPAVLPRIEHAFHARPDLCQTRTQRPPNSYLAHRHALGPPTPARFWVDSLTHDPDALRLLIRLFTPERIALGSDYPFPLGEDTPGAMIAALRDLPAATRARLLHASAAEFLGLP